MAKKPLEAWEAEELEARLAGIGREFYQLMEDYPVPSGWSYADFFMFINQRIYDEAMRLKKAAIAASSKRDKLFFSVIAPVCRFASFRRNKYDNRHAFYAYAGLAAAAFCP
jgi:hypothetical protein